MSAVWRASRAAVKRRRFQTFVIGFVLLFSTSTIVIALGLLDVSSGPFDRAFARQQGAHVVASFDPAKTDDGRLADTAHRPGVTAAAGPFHEAVLDVPQGAGYGSGGAMTVVGRADPGGPVDRLNVWAGRWATGPGEIVLATPGSGQLGPDGPLGKVIRAPGRPLLTIVGLASDLSQSADAWVSPEQIDALRPGAVQMLYRFADSDTQGALDSSLARATEGLPAGALTTAQPYLTIKQQVEAVATAYVPFLMLFGILGLAVAVLIVGNVVSGAVVAGFRHIGVLKSLGFTPRQVVAVYLVMMSVPAVAGTVLGTGLGALLTHPLVENVFNGRDAGAVGGQITVGAWVDVAALLGMPLLVLLAALVPALRAGRLSAARAVSAGSAQQRGRGLRTQRLLSGSRLPRSVSLGLGLPFTRPGRTAMTMAAVLLGVVTVTVATGLSTTMVRWGDAVERIGVIQVEAHAHLAGRPGATPSKLRDPEREALFRSTPGGQGVTSIAYTKVHLLGEGQSVDVGFLRGDYATQPWAVVKGRWLAGPGEVTTSGMFLKRHGLAVGDHLTMEVGGRQVGAVIVGQTLSGPADFLQATWPSEAAAATGLAANAYEIRLAPGTDTGRYIAAVSAADPGMDVSEKTTVNAGSVSIIGSASALTLMLTIVAALGVFNTVVLNTRERRRDLGMLKSIGMTPRQVTAMMVTSMAALGVIGGLVGLPLGILGHRVLVPAMVSVAGTTLPPSMLHVWQPLPLALLALAGVGIAVLGALIPARSAARQSIAEVMRSE